MPEPDSLPRVVLVDNDPHVRALIRQILEVLPIRLEEFANGQKAFDFVCTHAVKLVITNLRMPGLDGNELLTTIRRDRRHASVKVLVVSGYGDSISLDESPDGFVTKPFDADEMRQVVRDLLAAA